MPTRFMLIGVFFFTAIPSLHADDLAAGEKLYARHCAYCHGKQGEGSKRYEHTLTGDRSIDQLTKVIDETMPESDPGAIVGDDAKLVATYIHSKFTSKSGNGFAPPRVELARLTVPQYRYAVADLIARYRGRFWIENDKQGLKAEYYKSRRTNKSNLAKERIDANIDFNFGDKPPVEGIDPKEYRIFWSGTIVPPETGNYEIIIKSSDAIEVYLNDAGKMFIDGKTRSENEDTFEESMFMLAGRPVQFRLHFNKGKQGVTRLAKNKKSNAYITLMWKRPDGTTETIPAHCFVPGHAPKTFAVSTPFPPDDRSMGWIRGTTISKQWDEATTDGAIQTANYVLENLDELTKSKVGNTDRDKKLRQFAETFVTTAFRAKLSDLERKLYIDRQFERSKNHEDAIKRVVVLTLKSPRFLYREVDASNANQTKANRLAFVLWDSLPDQQTLNNVQHDWFGMEQPLRELAQRMLDDPRTKAKIQQFLHSWLKIDQHHDLAKDTKKYAEFTPEVIADLQTSLDLTLSDIVWNNDSDFRKLFLDNDVYLNERLAKLYGVTAPKDGFKKIPFNKEKRAGVLTHPYMMATFAYNDETSPIHRGVFLARGVLGVTLNPPPDAFTPLAADLHPNLTTRERTILQTQSTNCQTCHGIINPLGFALEGFDPIGRIRDTERNKPIDAGGSYQTRDGKVIKFTGARELAQFLASSPDVHKAFVEQMFHFMVQQPIRAYGDDALEKLTASFEKNGYNIQKLAVDIALLSAMKK